VGGPPNPPVPPACSWQFTRKGEAAQDGPEAWRHGNAVATPLHRNPVAGDPFVGDPLCAAPLRPVAHTRRRPPVRLSARGLRCLRAAGSAHAADLATCRTRRPGCRSSWPTNRVACVRVGFGNPRASGAALSPGATCRAALRAEATLRSWPRGRVRCRRSRIASVRASEPHSNSRQSSPPPHALYPVPRRAGVPRRASPRPAPDRLLFG